MEEAKARHPAAWRPDMARLRMRMAEVLASEGAEHPEMGARALAARGSLRLDRPSLAALFDVEDSTVEALEAGHLGADHVPRALRILFCATPSLSPPR